MVESAISSLFQVFAWPAFAYMLVGIVIGFIVGILPGLGATTTMALMVPYTFPMKPVEAFAFLLGMYSVTSVTGDITSILFGVPGEPTTAALVIDGYPMAKNGEAGRALGAGLASSLFGAVVGAVALVLSVPIIQPLVLSFGSPEFFMLAVMGLTFVAAVSGGTVVKGLIAAAFGMLLATVGQDPQLGFRRYTFDQDYLVNGLDIIAFTIGLYAVPEIIDLELAGTSIARRDVGALGGVGRGLKDSVRYWWLTIRCSLIGTFCGMLPGLGGVVAQWLAYAHVVQSSPDKEKFGKGDVRAVIGPSAASNSKEGGNLITVLGFGLPSTVTMAILLGAMLIHGLQPGPDMLTKHLDVTFSMVWVIVVSHVITVVVCLLFLKQIVRITTVRGSLLVPFLYLLIFMGAYTENNQVVDMLFMLVAGLMGVVMIRFDWPRPPLVLGIILGSVAERYLMLATQRDGLAWLERPVVLVILCLIIAIVAFSVADARRRAAGVASPIRMG